MSIRSVAMQVMGGTAATRRQPHPNGKTLPLHK